MTLIFLMVVEALKTRFIEFLQLRITSDYLFQIHDSIGLFDTNARYKAKLWLTLLVFCNALLMRGYSFLMPSTSVDIKNFIIPTKNLKKL